MAKHSKGVQKERFCALRTGSDQHCPHSDGSPGNNYRQNCLPAWSHLTFVQGRKKKVEKEFEAHHLLCVASVTGLLANKRKIASIIRQTKWCINAEQNMLAMPLWGHTIKHYCDIGTPNRIKLENRFKDDEKAPLFKNIPQHDYDHNSKMGYKNEVDKKIQNLANQVDDSRDKHNDEVKNLQKSLNDLCGECRKMLSSRGKRCGGTHKAWEAARSKGLRNWFEPFSMADDDHVDPRAFPLTGVSDSELANKIQALVKAFGKWGVAT